MVAEEYNDPERNIVNTGELEDGEPEIMNHYMNKNYIQIVNINFTYISKISFHYFKTIHF